MSKSCIINILAHNGGVLNVGSDYFRRHLPLWKKFGHPIQVWSPINDAVECDETSYTIGWSNFTRGQGHADRLRKILTMFVQSTYDYTVIAESDSISLRDQLVLEPGLHGIMQKDAESFIAPKYVMSPWAIDKDSAIDMLAKWDRYPNIYELGCIDRLISALAYISGVPIIDYAPHGFTFNTITVEMLPRVRDCILNGGKEIHGIKDSFVLSYILALHNSFLSNDPRLKPPIYNQS